MLIGISGYIGSGKDTLADMIRYQLHLRRLQMFIPNNINFLQVSSEMTSSSYERWNSLPVSGKDSRSGTKVKKYAAALKQIVAILLNVNAADLEDTNFKNSLTDPIWTRDGKLRTYRQVMQEVGTELFREHFHENTWTNVLMGGYKPDEYGVYPDWIVTDVRFPNEAAAIKAAGGILIRIGGLTTTSDHESEIGLDDYDDWDYHILNQHKYSEGWLSPEESLQHLMYDVNGLVNHFKLMEYAGTNRKPEATQSGSTKSPQ